MLCTNISNQYYKIQSYIYTETFPCCSHHLILKKRENSSTNSARVTFKKRLSKVKSKILKVDSNEKLGGSKRQKLIFNLALWRSRFIWIWTCLFQSNSLFPFPLATAHLIGDVATNRQSVAKFLKGFNFSKANSIGRNSTSAPLGKADQICRMNFPLINCDFADFLGNSPDITYSKSQLDAPIYWQEHFVSALPNRSDIAIKCSFSKRKRK